MSGLQDFNTRIVSAVRSQNGSDMRRLMRMTSPEAAKAMREYICDGGRCAESISGPWASLPAIVQHRFHAGAAVAANNWADAYTHLNSAVLEYVNSVLPRDDAWSMPMLHVMCADLRVLAEQADYQLTQERSRANKLEDVERTLKKAFTVTNNDRTNVGSASKRVGILEVINQLFRVYFKLNELRLCQSLIRTVNAPGFLDFESSFPVSHRVTYKYFVGRLHLYEDRYDDAIDNLTYAVTRIPANAEANKRLVLLYLIPAKILRGSLPSHKLLDHHSMYWYEDITRALKCGDMSLFDSAIARHEHFFIQKGLYLCVEKIRTLVYRSLCYTLHKVRRKIQQHDAHKISLDDYKLSLRLCGVDMSKNEVECILANLIYNGYIKGYISHKFGYLVLSTKVPFPDLQSIKPRE